MIFQGGGGAGKFGSHVHPLDPPIGTHAKLYLSLDTYSFIHFFRWNRLAYIGVTTVGCALCSLVLPWVPSFTVMFLVRIATGIFCGAIDTGKYSSFIAHLDN